MQPTFHRNCQPVFVDVLTPVAIGSGQILDPMRYTLCRDEDKGFSLHFIDLEQWLMDNSDDLSLLQMLESNKFLQIRKRIHQDLENPEVRQRYSVARRASSNSDLLAKFSEEMSKGDDSRHRLEIVSGLSNPLTNRLLLAGSSIKGAIRTAILDYLDHKYKLSEGVDKKRLQGEIDSQLGKISDHAFKSLRVQDCEVPHAQSCLVSAEEKRLNGKNERPGTPKLPTEAIAPKGHDSDRYVRPVTTVTLGFNSSSSGAMTVEATAKIRQRELFDWMRLAEIVTGFYRDRFRAEFDKFYRQIHLHRTGSLLEPIRQRVENLPGDSMLLRIGHYSHVECMTISNGEPKGRAIRDRRTGTSITVGPGTTRTLADGLLPFGWIILSPTDAAAHRNYQHELQKELTNRREAHQKQVEIRERAAEDARKQFEETQRAREEEQRKLEKRLQIHESVTPLQRLLDELRNGVITRRQNDGLLENQLPDYEAEYSRLDGFEGDEQRELASIFKEFYIRDGKWFGRLSTKQQQKVTRICEILGEGTPGESTEPSTETQHREKGAAKPWPNKKKTLPTWIQQADNLLGLDIEQLGLLRQEAVRILKNRAGESLEKIDERLRELEDR